MATVSVEQVEAGRAGPASAEPARYLCDAMLAHLARWLRAAGHDTALVPPHTPDREILAWARSEGRLLLTCDRRLTGRGVRVLHLPMADIDQLAAELAGRAGVDWQHAPLSRCLVDNTPLRPATAAEIGRLPEPTRRLPGPFHVCPACERIFWPGSHVRRMQARLAAFASHARRASCAVAEPQGDVGPRPRQAAADC